MPPPHPQRHPGIRLEFWIPGFRLQFLGFQKFRVQQFRTHPKIWTDAKRYPAPRPRRFPKNGSWGMPRAKCTWARQDSNQMHVGAPGLEQNAYFWNKTRARRLFLGQNSSETLIFRPKLERDAHPGAKTRARRSSRSQNSSETRISGILDSRNPSGILDSRIPSAKFWNSGFQEFRVQQFRTHPKIWTDAKRYPAPRPRRFPKNGYWGMPRAKCTWARQDSNQMHVGAPGFEPNAYFWNKTRARRLFLGQNSSETLIFRPKLERDAYF